MTACASWFVIVALLVGTGPVACSLNSLLDGSQSGIDSTSVVDPDIVKSYTGAVGMYYAAISSTRIAIGQQVAVVGMFTDELNESGGNQNKTLDGRIATDLLTGGIVGSYAGLQTARVQAAQASAALLRYGTPASYPLVGHAYALQAHAITLLAEIFCSGIPLTEAPLGGTLTYTPGFSTTALLERAAALFDTAYQYGKDSLPIATFAKVGKGRALLDLGRFADARAAVSDVATTAQYLMEFSDQEPYIPVGTSLDVNENRIATADREGRNGIQWTAPTPAQQDPRLLFATNSASFVVPLKEQKYLSASEVVPIADGIQARMIEAEANLQPAEAPSGMWLQALNAARATVGLPDTTDPGTKDGRINLVFRERAFWFYLRAQRLGDLRRLVRQYGRQPVQVYPTGPYPSPSLEVPSYGSELVFVPPLKEQQYNPLYKGCINKSA